jgi:hypothetical protein
VQCTVRVRVLGAAERKQGIAQPSTDIGLRLRGVQVLAFMKDNGLRHDYSQC